MKIVMSSGHGLLVRGASGIIDEVDEARRVVEEVANRLRLNGHEVTTFHDDTSTTQDENLKTIVNFHNAQDREVDVSVHFNAYEDSVEPKGTECLYVTQAELSARVAGAISEAGDLINRGPKYRGDLYFLNNTEQPSILIEVCFVDSEADVTNYQANFDVICGALGDIPVSTRKSPLARFEGSCSWFGGPDDDGVDPGEGLAFFYAFEDAPHLFLPEQPEDTTGLARRLDPDVMYVACRWDYDVTPKDMLADPRLLAMVRKKGSKKAGILAWPADWGPHEDTGRAADLSPGLMDKLGIDTDDEVEVIYPARRKEKK